MRNLIAIVTIGMLVSAALPMDAAGQAGTSIFVVYGTMYEEDGITLVDDDYLITVEILLKDKFSQLNLGENDGPGRYSVTWVDYEGGMVVEDGDMVVVKAEKEGELTFGLNYIVTFDDIGANQVRLDINRGMISTGSNTWGAIKSLYR